MEINDWWYEDPEERFWVETTDRATLGKRFIAQLLARRVTSFCNQLPGYSLIHCIEKGDVVFHYDTTQAALIGWSTAKGPVKSLDLSWHWRDAPPSVESTRPGWFYPLTSHRKLSPP